MVSRLIEVGGGGWEQWGWLCLRVVEPRFRSLSIYVLEPAGQWSLQKGASSVL